MGSDAPLKGSPKTGNSNQILHFNYTLKDVILCLRHILIRKAGSLSFARAVEEKECISYNT